MAINAAVISTAEKYARYNNSEKAAEYLMSSAKALSEVVLVIRETLKIVEARGVDLKNIKVKFNHTKFHPRLLG
jgi:2-dehydropantoate 2-reductase